jgi:hypothetical protein
VTTTITQVLDGIRDAIRTGLAGDVLAGRTYSLSPDSLNPPTVVVVPGPGDFLFYDDTFSGTDNYVALVKVLNGTQDSQSSQALLLSYMAKSGALSIRAAILADPKLGGICAYMEIPTAQNYGDVEWAGQQFLGFELSVAVFT